MKKNPYILFCKKWGLLIALLFMIDRGLGLFIKKMFYNESQGESSITTNAITKTKADILVFGSSRASHHYDTKFISSHLKMSVYNCGKDGMNIRYANAILPEILHRYIPNTILLDVTANELVWKNGKEGDDILLTSLLPYIRESELIRNKLISINKLEVIKSECSMLYQFNSLPASILQHYLGIGQQNINGYEALSGNNVTELSPVFDKDSTVKGNKEITYELEDFIRTVKENHIRLYVFISPMYGNHYPTTTKGEMEQLFKNEKVPFYDFSNYPGLLKKEFYFDWNHLNSTGAILYDSVIVNSVLKN